MELRVLLSLSLARLFYRLGLIDFGTYFNSMIFLYGELGLLRVKYVELRELVK